MTHVVDKMVHMWGGGLARCSLLDLSSVSQGQEFGPWSRVLDIHFLYWGHVVGQLYFIHRVCLPYVILNHSAMGDQQADPGASNIVEGPQINRKTLKVGTWMVSLFLWCPQGPTQSRIIGLLHPDSPFFPPWMSRWEVYQETLDTYLPGTRQGHHRAWCINTLRF